MYSPAVMLCPPLALTCLQLHFLAELNCFIQEIKDDDLWSRCLVAFNENPKDVMSSNGIQFGKCSEQA